MSVDVTAQGNTTYTSPSGDLLAEEQCDGPMTTEGWVCRLFS